MEFQTIKLQKMVSAALIGVALLSPVASLAGELKIGVINLDRVLEESAPAIKSQKKLEKEFDKRDQELQGLAKKLKDMQASVDKGALTMTDAEQRNKERDFNSLSADFQRKQREFREDLNVRRNEELKGLQERTSAIIKKIAEDNKISLVVQDAVYFSKDIDITDKVLSALSVDAPAGK